MRSGNLTTPAHILELDADLNAVTLDWVWCGIQTKEAGEVAYPNGLRNPAKVTIRAWYDVRLVPGRYLRADGRLMHIDSVRDFTGTRAEVAITATEFVGVSAAYTPVAGAPSLDCRVFLVHAVNRPGELTGRAEYITQIEAPLIEVGRPQPGSVFLVDGVAWRVGGLVEDDDDRIVRRMWVKRT
jgi:hypothetical protein